MTSSRFGRLYSLDLVRGLAALSIVIWHWQHLYFIGRDTGFEVTAQPAYWLFFPIYLGGWMAVELFFCISGFVFFWLYSEALVSRSMGARTFFALRFSRLYPLYFLTLAIVVVGQAIYIHYVGNPFIYAINVENVIRNVFLTQNWSSRSNETINGPAWSISVELLLYVIFFIYCRCVSRVSVFVLIGLVLIGFPLALVDADLGRGLISFFSGGVTYFIYHRLHNSPAARSVLVMSAGAAVAGWIMTIVELKFGPIQSVLGEFVRSLPAPLGDAILKSAKQILIIPVRLVLIPASILALVLSESLGAGAYRKFAAIGDITYSSYLIHYPMQLFIAIYVVATAGAPQIFQSGTGMALFFCVLIILSFSSYRWFEVPMQRYLRSVLLRSLASENGRPSSGSESRTAGPPAAGSQ
ncbi:hypothetical protein C2U70_30875 [Bradyrhizobium guangdongense]|uniref:acyltransferase family protein n=1 Tax=Bradyrhizobium guangdongense TaxID=1325090 RepID=UPI00112AB5F8|nr:acyltransferase [Bradyrhizobium guangdongense]TPQ27235.1 hypothetical protein C2U70_30875 [Bradyrhizobium guangdongense]